MDFPFLRGNTLISFERYSTHKLGGVLHKPDHLPVCLKMHNASAFRNSDIYANHTVVFQTIMENSH
jgi:hypothetical protein